VAVLPSLNNSPLTSAFGPATVAYAFFKDEGTSSGDEVLQFKLEAAQLRAGTPATVVTIAFSRP
jgi:hypothetical protein